MKQRSLRGNVVAGVAVAFALTSAAPLSAQEATPVPAVSATVVGPCTSAPRAVDEMLALFFDAAGNLLATPAAAYAGEVPESQLPQGPAVDPAVLAAMDERVRQFLARANAGLIPQEFANFTDNHLRQFGPNAGTTPDQIRVVLEQMAAGTPPAMMPETPELFLAPPRASRQLGPTRAGAIWDLDGDIAYIEFEQQADGHWLIDAVADVIDPVPAATAATPVASPSP